MRSTIATYALCSLAAVGLVAATVGRPGVGATSSDPFAAAPTHEDLTTTVRGSTPAMVARQVAAPPTTSGATAAAPDAGCVDYGDGHVHCDAGDHRTADAVFLTSDEETALIADAEARGVGIRPDLVAARTAPSAAQVGDPGVAGSWGPVIDWPVVGVHMSLMANGNVLVFDSIGDAPTESYPVHDRTRAMVFSPTSGSITRNDFLGYNVFCAGLAKLADGRVFLAGGNKNAALVGINRTTLFDPATGTFSATALMSTERWYPSVTPLPNGEMLIVGGGPALPEVRATSGSIRRLTAAAQSLWAVREYPFFVTAPNGRAQYIGPANALGQMTTSGSGAYTAQGARDGKIRSYGSFALYEPGYVLVNGGGYLDASGVSIDLNTTAVTAVASMANQRRQHNLTMLADGSVLATGGFGNSNQPLVDLANAVYAAERWDPATNTWTVLASAARARQYHSGALLLPDGRVLSAGGGICGACLTAGYLQRNAEIFSPPYLFKKDGSGALADRPVIGTAPARVGYATTFGVSSPNASAITKVGLARLGSVTHSVDMEQRYVPLTFTSTSSTVTITAPANANLAPPGQYMLVIVDAAGVPSVAKIVEVGAATANAAPTVAITAPPPGTSVAVGSVVNVTANASDPDGLIVSARLFDNGAEVGLDDTAPYAFAYAPTTSGARTLTVRVTDDRGTSTTSAGVALTVSGSATTTTSTSTTTTRPPSTTTTSTTTTPSSGDLVVYGDALSPGWADWSWATHSLASPSPALGSRAVSWEPDNWAGIALHHDSLPRATSKLRFSMNGGPVGGQVVRVYMTVNGVAGGEATVSDLGGPIPANAWRTYEIPFTSPVPAGASVLITFQDWSGVNQGTLSVDSIFLANGMSQTTTTTSTTRPATTSTTSTTLPPTTSTTRPVTTSTSTTSTTSTTTTSTTSTTSTLPPVTSTTSTTLPTATSTTSTTSTTRPPTTTTTTQPPGGGTRVVYEDALANAEDWGWSTHNYASTSPVYSGLRAMAMTMSAWAGHQIHLTTPFSAATGSRLEFWIHGGTLGVDDLKADFVSGSTVRSAVVAVPPNSWQKVTVDLNAIGITSATPIEMIVFFHNSPTARGTVSIDAMRFVP